MLESVQRDAGHCHEHQNTSQNLAFEGTRIRGCHLLTLVEEDTAATDVADVVPVEIEATRPLNTEAAATLKQAYNKVVMTSGLMYIFASR